MMTPLRRRMLEDMQLRNLCTETQRNYVHHVCGLARFYQTSPENLCLEEILEEIREYQLYLLNERRLSAESVNQFVSAAKFLYNVTLETPWPECALPRGSTASSNSPCAPAKCEESPIRRRNAIPGLVTLLPPFPRMGGPLLSCVFHR